ncbi:hypothetical protein GCM10027046_04230 [Uliginosibacterium flavum]|uniref:Uncharacterized protein n=1 Tax=Uliginosibacterium flavum TaxID=1396831 RepID=A0ABV2TJA5_9RHOO
MKLQVLGVKRVKGESKESGAPFDMCRIIALSPIESMASGKLQITGAGFEVAEMSLLPEAMPKFLSLPFPCDVELVIEPRAYRGKFESFVVGFLPAAK